MNGSLNQLYKAIGISKQAVHKQLKRRVFLHGQELQIIYLVEQIRRDHPDMGLRTLYFKLQPSGIGRDRFEALCKENGLLLQRKPNYKRTTNSFGVKRFDNRIKELIPSDINQIWQSDITYYEISGRFYFLTFIQDAYSKLIVGYSVSKGLTTEETTLAALKMALRNRKGYILKGLIFHSDGGGQYYDRGFLQLTSQYGIQNSMCEYAWENGMAERLNGVIKNKYLVYKSIQSFEELRKEVDRTVLLYNQDKPHTQLNRNTPFQFESNLVKNKEYSIAIN